jgi:hypothetical protein
VIINGGLTPAAGALGFGADVGFNDNSQGLKIGARYGVTSRIAVGASYAFALNDFEIKGPLTLVGALGLANNGKMALAVSVDYPRDFSAKANWLDVGIALRYKLTPQFAIYTGNPYTMDTSGQQLRLGKAKTLSIPVGAAFQVIRPVYLYAETTVATITLSDPMGDRVSSYNKVIPFNIGAWITLSKALDVGASFHTDFKGVSDNWNTFVGARSSI